MTKSRSGPARNPAARAWTDITKCRRLPPKPLAMASPDTPQLSFRLAQPVPDLGFRQSASVHAQRSGAACGIWPNFSRITYLRQRRIQHVKDVAPRNGHGRRASSGIRNELLLFDADDTLWENNIYFESAFDDFVEFLDHSAADAGYRFAMC